MMKEMNLKAFLILLVSLELMQHYIINIHLELSTSSRSGPYLALPIMFSPRHPSLYLHSSLSPPPRTPPCSTLYSNLSRGIMVIIDHASIFVVILKPYTCQSSTPKPGLWFSRAFYSIWSLCRGWENSSLLGWSLGSMFAQVPNFKSRHIEIIFSHINFSATATLHTRWLPAPAFLSTTF